MLPNRWLKDHVQTAENCQKFICETSCSLYEYIANDRKKGSFHSWNSNCTRKFYLCQVYPKNTLICYNLIL